MEGPLIVATVVGDAVSVVVASVVAADVASVVDASVAVDPVVTADVVSVTVDAGVVAAVVSALDGASAVVSALDGAAVVVSALGGSAVVVSVWLPSNQLQDDITRTRSRQKTMIHTFFIHDLPGRGCPAKRTCCSEGAYRVLI